MKVLILCLTPLSLTSCDHSTRAEGQATAAVPSPQPAAATTTDAPEATLPRLVDLGATRCIPCRMMAPTLDGLREEYAGVVSVEFIDVWENPSAGDLYGIRVIPTQIFYDAQGTEVLRHQGFMPREDIVAQFEAMGISPPPHETE
ncbi:MAG: thioredoxin family protein [Candidatus Sumerlaeia bacterium]|nr:thioredoxin family protein [Candidatus Sumerlaeia bacterium]